VGFHSEEQWVQWIDQLAQHDYVVINDFMLDDQLNEVLSYMQVALNNQDFKPAAIGTLDNRQRITNIRGDRTFWLDRKRDQQVENFFLFVDEMIARINRLCFLSLAGYEFHYAHYPERTFYKRHVDQFKDRSNRLITFILYLNDRWSLGDGGELMIYKGDQEIKVEPIMNRCVLFKTEGLEHEVLLSNTSRFSLTGWLLYQPSGVGYLLT
jgi:SM-20-related protein